MEAWEEYGVSLAEYAPLAWEPLILPPAKRVVIGLKRTTKGISNSKKHFAMRLRVYYEEHTLTLTRQEMREYFPDEGLGILYDSPVERPNYNLKPRL